MLKIWERGEEEFKISILSGEERNNRKLRLHVNWYKTNGERSGSLNGLNRKGGKGNG